MASVAESSTIRNVRQRLELQLEAVSSGSNQVLVDAIRGYLTAVDYEDSALARSHFQSMGEAIAETANNEIEKSLRWLAPVNELCASVRAIDGQPGSEFDALGSDL